MDMRTKAQEIQTDYTVGDEILPQSAYEVAQTLLEALDVLGKIAKKGPEGPEVQSIGLQNQTRARWFHEVQTMARDFLGKVSE